MMVERASQTQELYPYIYNTSEIANSIDINAFGEQWSRLRRADQPHILYVYHSRGMYDGFRANSLH